MTTLKINQEIQNVQNGYPMTVVKETKLSYVVECNYLCVVTNEPRKVNQTHSKTKVNQYLKSGQWTIN